MGKAEDLIDALKPVDGRPLEFIARGCVHVLDSENRKDLTLRPLYEIADQKYTVYMDLFTQEQWAKRKAEYQAQLERQAEMEARTVDVLRIGEMQPERDHNQQGQNTRTGEYGGKRWRDADNGGWFSFDMKVLPDAPVDLQVTYCSESELAGRTSSSMVARLPNRPSATISLMNFTIRSIRFRKS